MPKKKKNDEFKTYKELSLLDETDKLDDMPHATVVMDLVDKYNELVVSYNKALVQISTLQGALDIANNLIKGNNLYS